MSADELAGPRVAMILVFRTYLVMVILSSIYLGTVAAIEWDRVSRKQADKKRYEEVEVLGMRERKSKAYSFVR